MDAYQVVREFEQTVAHWAGAKYGVAVSSCCNAIFLCLKMLEDEWSISIPKRTYPGVAMAIKNAGHNLYFNKFVWEGTYELNPVGIVDSALRFKKRMYRKTTLHCLSFHYRKHLPIGRGGMVLTDDKFISNWLKMARYNGRREIPLYKDNATILGYSMYMTPEQAARGLVLFNNIKDKNLPDLKMEDQHYPDLSQWRCFK